MKLRDAWRASALTAAGRSPATSAYRKQPDQVVVDEPCGLHQRIADRRPDEPEAAPPEVGAHRLRGVRLGRDRAHRHPCVLDRRPAGERPQVVHEGRPRVVQGERRWALPIAAATFARLRTMPGSARSRATSASPNAATAATSNSRTPPGSPRACAGWSTTTGRPARPRGSAARTGGARRGWGRPTPRRDRRGRRDPRRRPTGSERCPGRDDARRHARLS